jgi:16S rRNA (uracil1498-N3)-methyltransferase
MKHRLYLPEAGLALPEAGQVLDCPDLRLVGDQAHYLSRVLRLRPDSELACFDGHGREWRCRLLTSSSRRCTLRIIELIRHEPQPTELTLAQAWLKGAAMDTVVQKATELGTTRIWLFPSDRSNVKLQEHWLQNKLRHLLRVATSAAEQSGATWLPRIEQKSGMRSVLDSSGSHRRIVLEPGQQCLDVGGAPYPLLLAIGPEGGWSDRERAFYESLPEVTAMGLGSMILRAETVPLAALAAVRHSWGWRSHL